MMTSHMFLEILENIDKPKKPDLITENRRGKWITYFRKSKQRVGVGFTEIEALDNLKNY